MPLFEITETMTAVLIVECNSEKEAVDWAGKIIAGVEDENGNAIESDEIILFEADVEMSKIKIRKLTKKRSGSFRLNS